MLQLGKAAAEPETSVQDCVSTFSNTFTFYLQRCVTGLLESFPSVRSVHLRSCVFCYFSRLELECFCFRVSTHVSLKLNLNLVKWKSSTFP